MSETPLPPLRKPRRIGRLILCAVMLCLGLCLIPELVIMLPLHLIFGWAFFLARVSTQVRPDIESIVSVVVASLLFLLIGNWLISSLSTKTTGESRWNFRCSLLTLQAVMISFTAGLGFVGTTHQLGWMLREPAIFIVTGSATEAARRTQSRNNLKRLGLAAHEYHDEWQAFPSGGSLLQRGIPGHSWQTTLLPFLENKELFDQIDLNQSWRADQNKPAFKTTIPVFLSPMIRHPNPVTETGYAPSHYAGNVHVLSPGRSLKIYDISDGTSNTLFSGEARSNFKPWGDPTNGRDPTLGINQSPEGFGGPWSQGGAIFSFADGSVRFMSDKIDPKVLKALATPNGGEDLTGVEW